MATTSITSSRCASRRKTRGVRETRCAITSRTRVSRTLVHYPLALQQVEALRERVVFRQTPLRAARAAHTILSLPIYPELPAGHQEQVIRGILDFA